MVACSGGTSFPSTLQRAGTRVWYPRCRARATSRLASLTREGLGLASAAVDRVDPAHLFRWLGGRDVEVDDDGLLPAADDHALERLRAAGGDLLLWHRRGGGKGVAPPPLLRGREPRPPPPAR